MFNSLCLRCRAFSPSALRTSTSSNLAITRTRTSLAPTTVRAFSSSSIQQSPLFRSIPQATRPCLQTPSSTTPGSSSGSVIGIGIGSFGSFQGAQTRSFSASSSLGAKRDTYNPSRRVQKRRHGFLARKRTRTGRNLLKRRRAKGKRALSW